MGRDTARKCTCMVVMLISNKSVGIVWWVNPLVAISQVTHFLPVRISFMYTEKALL